MAGQTGGKRPGAGRPKGVPNKATADIKALAQQYGEQAVQTLAKLLVEGESQQVQIAAAKELLDRGYGKAKQMTELSGPGGATASIKVVFGDDDSDSQVSSEAAGTVQA